jgi:hypothetical protein
VGGFGVVQCSVLKSLRKSATRARDYSIHLSIVSAISGQATAISSPYIVGQNSGNPTNHSSNQESSPAGKHDRSSAISKDKILLGPDEKSPLCAFVKP